MSDNSEFSSGSTPVGADPKTFNKKDKKKVKERPYTHLGEDLSSAEEEATPNNENKSPVKSKKPKAFMFGSAKKDKKKEVKSENQSSLAAGASNTSTFTSSNVPEAKKKEKNKLKLKKSSKHSDKSGQDDQADEENSPIFGVPLEVAAHRHKCHDGIAIPLLVRECIDFIETEGGIMSEGIYRSSGVKSKVNKLKVIYDSPSKRNAPGSRLKGYDCTVVASVLKLFLRELPDLVLTKTLMPRFEAVSSYSDPQSRAEGMKNLMSELPECNRVLIQWIFVHMTRVIERERFNKMTLQNVSIVLSPTMKISHRVLNCFFENTHILFADGVQLKKYVPPLTAETLNTSGLPENRDAIEEEIRKQDSLLADLHLQISSGAASKKTEEQIWEQQRIVTQLKRKLRTTKKTTNEGPDDSSDPSSSSQSAAFSKPKYEPIDYEEELDFSLQTPATVVVEEKEIPEVVEEVDQIKEDSEVLPSTTEDKKEEEEEEEIKEETKMSPQLEEKKEEPEQEEKTPIETIIVKKKESHEDAEEPTTKKSDEQENNISQSKPENVTVIPIGNEDEPDTNHSVHKVAFKLPSSTNANSSVFIPASSGFPLLPPPPGKSGNLRHQRILQPVPASPPKSKSLPRGFPLAPSEIYDFFEKEEECQEEVNEKSSLENDEDLLETIRLQFEYDELTALMSELIRRKEIEKKEIEELKEEIASMQTLYQYRTCSVDSSESSSDEGSDKEDGIEELAKTLSDLLRENKELEDTRMELQQKIQDERSACINIRVQIKLEQEKMRLKAERKLAH